MKSLMESRNNKFEAFFTGFCSAFDFSGSYSPLITLDDLQDGPRKDANALRGDWLTVGNDLRFAMDRYQREFQNQ